MISIVDYGAGNIASISRLISYLGSTSKSSSNPEEILSAKKIILPGVGHFDHGMNSIKSLGLDKVLHQKIIDEGIPVLGICLGMQLLCQYSEEGNEKGIGFINAKVKRFRFSQNQKFKVPHMGWNVVYATKDNPLIPPVNEEQRFYFVHSYHVVLEDPEITIGTANYGYEFCAAFQKDNIFGVQFHPEKSHRFGMMLIKRFLEL